MPTSRLEAFSDGVFAIAPGSEAQAASVTRAYWWGVPSYPTSTLLAIWSVPLGVAANAAIAVFYLLPRKERTA